MILFYILGILRGIGVGIGGMVPITVIITNWFDEKHGLATSLALSFSGLAGAIFSPLLSSWIISYGWQMTYRLMASCILILVLPVLIVPWKINEFKSAIEQIVVPALKELASIT